MVGSTTQNDQFVNGQSMMFQLFADQLRDRNIQTLIVDFGKSTDPGFYKKRISGRFQFTKLLDNVLLVIHMFAVVVCHPNTPVYINTSQSKVGFLRDYLFIGIAKFFRRKVIAHQFGANYGSFYKAQSPSFQRKIKATLDRADVIVVEGDYAKQQYGFLKDHLNKVQCVTNGLPEKIDFTCIKPKQIKPDQPVQLLYLSNLIESKGYWDVLEAVNILVNQYNKDVKVVFSGQFLDDVEDVKFKSADDAREEFFKLVAKYNLENRVTYFEGLYKEDKKKAFNEAHFFLLPSYYIYEGQPVSVLEALAYGCVPVVTKYRLIPEMVNPENGFFVNPKMPAEIADAINLMINNPMQYERVSANGIGYFHDNFTAEKYVEKLVDLTF